MSRFLTKRMQRIAPYVPGEQPQDKQYIKLNTNESPYPPAPGIIEALSGEGRARALNLYPDPECKELADALARYHRVERSQLFVGNGSDEVLAFFFQAFCDEERSVCYPEISYGFYPVYAALFGIANAKAIPLREDFSIDIRDYLDCGRNIVIANPNAPTGLALSAQQIEEIVKANPDSIVLVDEAYVDFGAQTCVPLIDQYDNLLVVQTFSKSRSMAGARLGVGIGHADIIADLNRIKFSFNPYNVNRLTMVAGTKSVEDVAYFEECRKEIIKTREESRSQLAALGFQLTDSKTNFLFASHDRISGHEYYMKLKQRGILVRHFAKPEKIANYVRITVGTRQQMDKLIECTKDILSEV